MALLLSTNKTDCPHSLICAKKMNALWIILYSNRTRSRKISIQHQK